MTKLKEKSCRYLNIQKEIKYHLKGNEQSNRTQNRKESCQNLDKNERQRSPSQRQQNLDKNERQRSPSQRQWV